MRGGEEFICKGLVTLSSGGKFYSGWVSIPIVVEKVMDASDNLLILWEH